MRTSLLLAALALSLGTLYAQAEPGSAPAASLPELTADTAIGQDATAREMIQAFWEKKGWVAGENAKADGSFFLISVGYGTIAAPTSHDAYNVSRARAYDKAMLDAKAQMAHSLEQVIAVAVESRYKEAGEGTLLTDSIAAAAQKVAQDASESTFGKAVRLANRKLDNALTEAGDTTQANRERTQAELAALREKAAKVIVSDEFRKSISSAATCCVAGLQSFYTVEAQKGERGEIGVVAIWSPALNAMSASLVTGKPVTAKAAKAPIKAQLPTDKTALLSTFGVQQIINEKGEYVLVSFAQDAARTRSARAEQAAYAKARLTAQAQIRAFAGEAVSSYNANEAAESTLEYADGVAPDYTDASRYEQYQHSVAQAMECNGISTIKEWTAVHPISGKPVYGVICAWNPSQAARARQMKQQTEATAVDGAAGRRTLRNATVTPVQPGNGSVTVPKKADTFLNSGAAGDDDAF